MRYRTARSTAFDTAFNPRTVLCTCVCLGYRYVGRKKKYKN